MKCVNSFQVKIGKNPCGCSENVSNKCYMNYDNIEIKILGNNILIKCVKMFLIFYICKTCLFYKQSVISA